MQRFAHATELPLPPERVIELITSADYLEFRYADSSLMASEIDILQDDAEGFSYRVSREADTHRLPAFIRRLLGHRIRFVQLHRWTRGEAPYSGQLEIGVDGFEGGVDTRLLLAAADQGRTLFEAAGTIHAQVPLIGGRIEKMLLKGVGDNFMESRNRIVAWLEQQR